MESLAARGLDQAVVAAAKSGKPLLGLCLGMQLLAEEGSEFGPTRGLSLVPGSITLMAPSAPEYRVPHIGWNDVAAVRPSVLFRDMPDNPPCFYFVHSYGFADT